LRVIKICIVILKVNFKSGQVKLVHNTLPNLLFQDNVFEDDTGCNQVWHTVQFNSDFLVQNIESFFESTNSALNHNPSFALSSIEVFLQICCRYSVGSQKPWTAHIS
jgi:hypothetical protein